MSIINENEYSDDAYTDATIELGEAIASIWNSGATIDNIASELEVSLESAIGTVRNVRVRIEAH